MRLLFGGDSHASARQNSRLLRMFVSMSVPIDRPPQLSQHYVLILCLRCENEGGQHTPWIPPESIWAVIKCNTAGWQCRVELERCSPLPWHLSHLDPRSLFEAKGTSNHRLSKLGGQVLPYEDLTPTKQSSRRVQISGVHRFRLSGGSLTNLLRKRRR